MRGRLPSLLAPFLKLRKNLSRFSKFPRGIDQQRLTLKRLALVLERLGRGQGLFQLAFRCVLLKNLFDLCVVHSKI